MSIRQSCMLCSTVPENILVLVCNHSLCLPCSAQIVQTNPVNAQHLINCKSCHQATYLTSELYKELVSNLQTKQILMPLKCNQINSTHRLKQNESSNEISKSRCIQNMCSNHPDYVTIYVCKACCDAIICPQCVINGSHKNHAVNTIQKEGQAIASKLQKQLLTFTNKINDLNSIYANKNTHIQQRIQQLQNIKSKAKIQYRKIRESIDQQQAFVLKKCEQLINLNRQEMVYFQVSINNQLSIIENDKSNVIDLLNPFLEGTDSKLIQHYQKLNLLNFIKQYQVYSMRHHSQKPQDILFSKQILNTKVYDINTLRNRIQDIQNHNFNQDSRQQILNSLTNANKRQLTKKQQKFPKKVKHPKGLFTLI